MNFVLIFVLMILWVVIRKERARSERLGGWLLEFRHSFDWLYRKLCTVQQDKEHICKRFLDLENNVGKMIRVVPNGDFIDYEFVCEVRFMKITPTSNSKEVVDFVKKQ